MVHLQAACSEEWPWEFEHTLVGSRITWNGSAGLACSAAGLNVIVLCICPLRALAHPCIGRCEATEHTTTAILGALRLHEVARCGACVRSGKMSWSQMSPQHGPYWQSCHGACARVAISPVLEVP